MLSHSAIWVGMRVSHGEHSLWSSGRWLCYSTASQHLFTVNHALCLFQWYLMKR